jgi:menaquinone-dependent protoporphyrinogen oxidase
MSDKTLIAYATKAGSTAEVAQAIGQELREQGAEVDVRLMKDVKEVGSYTAVIVGSAIRMGKLLSEVTKFVKKNRDALGRVPVAYFVVCLTMKDDTEENRHTVDGYLDPVREMIEPVDVGLFAGVLDCDKLGFPWGPMMRRAKDQFPEGDYRDWEAIRAWARQVHARLMKG